MATASSDENAHLNRLGSGWMERGIALLEGSASDALHEAIRCFDEAIALRRKLPLAENPGFRYGLAAGWINRGDALTRLGGAANLAEAITSYTAAIELLKEPPADDDGSFVRRLAIAWMNRGITLEEQKCEAALAQAIGSYKHVIELLSGRCLTGGNLDPVLAGAWINLGNALLRSGRRTPAAEACGATEAALALLAESESNVLAAAEAGLKARHIFCQAAIVLLGETSDEASIEMDFINKMTDSIEGALSLAQMWEKAGVTCFRPLATQFFHLGALVYEKHQTHFLTEYLLDHLEPESPSYFAPLAVTWMTIAEESLSRIRSVLRNCDFASLTTPEGIRRLETLNEVRAAEERFRMLKCAAGAPDLCY